MAEQMHMIAGLPRSGSTLLCNLLNQNGRFAATPTSGLMPMLQIMRDQWEAQLGHQSHQFHDRHAAMRDFARAYHPTDRPVVFDKNRGWPSICELMTELFPHSTLIVTLRSVPEVLASMELRWRETNKYTVPHYQRANPGAFVNVATRCEYWMQSGGVVRLPLMQIEDAVRRGLRERMLYVHFDDLCRDPAKELADIHHRLGEDAFAYDPENIKDTATENYKVHGYVGLHEMRDNRIMSPPSERAKSVLGEQLAEHYRQFDFWKQSDG